MEEVFICFFVTITVLALLILYFFCGKNNRVKRKIYTPNREKAGKLNIAQTKHTTVQAQPFLKQLAGDTRLTREAEMFIKTDLPPLLTMRDIAWIIERIDTEGLAQGILPSIARNIPVDNLDLAKLLEFQAQCIAEIDRESHFLTLLICKFERPDLERHHITTECMVEQQFLDRVLAYVP